MKDVTKFATTDYPIRCSSLPSLVRCPWRAVMLFLELEQDISGVAADTGSAVHYAIKHWHDNPKGGVAEALEAMRAATADFPLADLDEARLHFTPYTLDPRNAPERANLVAIERKVEFTIDPADNDPTGEPIVIWGTLDQIRRGPDGRLYLWDVKTGKPEGWDMLHRYALQLVAYCVGASKELGELVHPGGIIRTRGWRKQGVDPTLEPPGVFFNAPYSREYCDLLLDSVRQAVALIRSGELVPVPGDYCSYCPSGGVENCLPKLVSLL